jgi:hypothetical protein
VRIEQNSSNSLRSAKNAAESSFALRMKDARASNVWRLIASADVGWALSSYSSMHLLYVGNPTVPRDYGLALTDTSASSLVLSPRGGDRLGRRQAEPILSKPSQILERQYTMWERHRLLWLVLAAQLHLLGILQVENQFPGPALDMGVHAVVRLRLARLKHEPGQFDP